MMWQTAPGAAVKAVESGEVEGLLVVFGSPDATDLENEWGSSRVDLQACKLGTGRRFTTS
jgi:hypothetical protein